MFKYLKGLPLAIIFLSCNTNKTVIVADPPQETATYIPLKDFILGELAGLDTLQLTPLYTTTKNNKTDSLWMTKKDIRKFCIPFLISGTDTITLKRYFSSRAFVDRSINAITLSYDPKGALPDSIPLRHCDIYIDPLTQTIKRLYMVVENKNVNHEMLQLTWKPGASAIISTIGTATNENQVKQEKMTWNFNVE